MGYALKKEGRLYIPVRDQSKVAKAKPCDEAKHVDQLANASALGMLRYENAMDKLSKV